ncbi:MAG: NAD(P)H-dependent oxidoreductase [Candidatus Peregrinibacteria bacterium]|nr:NAD(P)H-dependent oxidoreductase [Candidatus Peregrinibacteria bacterium]
MSTPLRVLGISGSLRKGSLNTNLLKAAQELAPSGISVDIADISQIPPYNADIDPFPAAVTALKKQVEAADAILIATPEYNFSITGVLKNVLDWISRPYGKCSLDDKPVAIMSASTGMLGGGRAQYHLRQVLVEMNAHAMGKPECIVTFAPEKFDTSGKLTDAKTREKIVEMLTALAAWTERLRE